MSLPHSRPVRHVSGAVGRHRSRCCCYRNARCRLHREQQLHSRTEVGDKHGDCQCSSNLHATACSKWLVSTRNLGRLRRCHAAEQESRECLALLHVSKLVAATDTQAQATCVEVGLFRGNSSLSPRAAVVPARRGTAPLARVRLASQADADSRSGPITSQPQPSQKPRPTCDRQCLVLLELPYRAHRCAARGGSRAAPRRAQGGAEERRWRARYPARMRRDGGRADISCNSTQQLLTHRSWALCCTTCRVPVTAVQEPSVQ